MLLLVTSDIISSNLIIYSQAVSMWHSCIWKHLQHTMPPAGSNPLPLLNCPDQQSYSIQP